MSASKWGKSPLADAVPLQARINAIEAARAGWRLPTWASLFEKPVLIQRPGIRQPLNQEQVAITMNEAGLGCGRPDCPVCTADLRGIRRAMIPPCIAGRVPCPASGKHEKACICRGTGTVEELT